MVWKPDFTDKAEYVVVERCVRTIVVWKHHYNKQLTCYNSLLRENHSGMETLEIEVVPSSSQGLVA